MAAPEPSGGAGGRDPNLDLLRAAAITLVFAFHTLTGGAEPAWVRHLAALGAYGVDLFFVLSGWLIGGLYFRELQRCGRVDLLRFWQRRWLRTLPPYFVGLALAYAAAWASRRAPFDWHYLLLIQNYRDALPFFTVSWSLCIEEHFYLALPVVLLLVARLGLGAPVLAAALLAPLVGRWLHREQVGAPLGYYLTATHLHLEGLAYGVAAAAVAARRPRWWALVRRYARTLAPPAVLLFLGMALWPRAAHYVAGYAVAPLLFVVVLAAVADAPPVPGAQRRVVRWVALSSYSIYLTHVLVLHALRGVLGATLGPLPWWLFAPAAAPPVFVVGWIFYRAVERPAIVLRERWVPRRSARRPDPPPAF